MDICFALFGVSCVMSQIVKELVVCWGGVIKKNHFSDVRNAVPYVRCGAYGGNKILGHLKEWRHRCFNCYFYFLSLYNG